MPDFSPESIDAGYLFVQKVIRQQIRFLENELATLLSASHDEDPTLFQSLVIAAAQDYRDDPDFENRWDLKEDKHKHYPLWKTDGHCGLCSKRVSHPDHLS